MVYLTVVNSKGHTLVNSEMDSMWKWPGPNVRYYLDICLDCVLFNNAVNC